MRGQSKQKAMLTWVTLASRAPGMEFCTSTKPDLLSCALIAVHADLIQTPAEAMSPADAELQLLAERCQQELRSQGYAIVPAMLSYQQLEHLRLVRAASSGGGRVQQHQPVSGRYDSQAHIRLVTLCPLHRKRTRCMKWQMRSGSATAAQQPAAAGQAVRAGAPTPSHHASTNPFPATAAHPSCAASLLPTTQSAAAGR